MVTLADQAHANRPQGGSTGGYLTMIGGSPIARGEAGQLSIVSWRTWRLKRKAISTHDGEIQSMVDGEDANFRTRFLWCQFAYAKKIFWATPMRWSSMSKASLALTAMVDSTPSTRTRAAGIIQCEECFAGLSAERAAARVRWHSCGSQALR